jgi:hypothetical protein
MTSYYDTASKNLDSWLNKEWAKGVKSSGKLDELQLTNVNALPGYLSLQSVCKGQINLRIDELNWSF